MSSEIDELIDFYKTKLNSIIYTGRWFKIDQNLIDEFAEVTGDEQWIHTDPHKAAIDSPYGTTIAHGFLTLSLIPFLTQSNDPAEFKKHYPKMSYGINYGLNKVRFISPVKVNSSVRAKVIPLSIENLGDCAEIIYKIIIEIKGQSKPALVAEQIFRVYK